MISWYHARLLRWLDVLWQVLTNAIQQMQYFALGWLLETSLGFLLVLVETGIGDGFLVNNEFIVYLFFSLFYFFILWILLASYMNLVIFHIHMLVTIRAGQLGFAQPKPDLKWIQSQSNNTYN